MPLYFQIVRGEGAVATGLLLAPQGIGVAIAMAVSGRLTDRVGGGRVALAGVLVTAAATVPFALFGAGDSYLLIGACMSLRGVGIGLAFVPAMAAAFAVMSPAQIPDATPQLNVLQRVGGSIGTAVLAVVLQGHIDALGARPTASGLAGSFNAAYWWATAVTLAAAVPAAVLIRAERAARRRAVAAPPPVPAPEAVPV